MGESGSGKSVTALSILRLLPPRIARTSGEILFEGRDMLRLDEKSLREVRGGRVGMIFQEPMTSLNPLHPIGRQIAENVILHQPGPMRISALSNCLNWSASRMLLPVFRVFRTSCPEDSVSGS